MRLLSAVCLVAFSAFAQYTPSAGRNAPAAAYDEVRDLKTGTVTLRKSEQEVPKDGHGNARGNQYDLAVDGAFDGQTVLILDQVGNATVQFSEAHGRTAALYDGEGGSARAPKVPAGFTPLLYGSAGNLVTVAYEKDGKRLLMDGGFTRLAVSWDDAGTARYVKNAAAWLVHAEKFKETVAAAR